MAVASLVRDERSMSLALRRHTSVFEAQCSTRRRSPSSSCRRAEDTYKVNFERKSDQEVRANDPMVPFVVKVAEQDDHQVSTQRKSNSSYKMVFGRDSDAEFGELLWCRIAARVAAGRGKCAVRLAGGHWVGSDIDDTHQVVNLERGSQEV